MNDKKRGPLSRTIRQNGVEPGGFISRRGKDASNLSGNNTQRVSSPVSRRLPSRSAEVENNKRILEEKREQAKLIRRRVISSENNDKKKLARSVVSKPIVSSQSRPSTRISRPVKKQTSIWWYLFKYALGLASAGVIAVFLLFSYWIFQAPDFDPKVLENNKKTIIYDVNNHQIGELGKNIGDNIDLNEKIPDQMKNAILATEDVRFYQHAGVDYIRLAGAFLSNITSGFGSQGGSTISQQLIKRTFLDDNKTLKRKVQEAYLAYKLEQNYNKDTIFNMYINRIYYSDGVYGLKTAANYYFEKDLNQLELGEMAFLAGLPQQPNGYNPYDSPEAAKKRRDTVLHLMAYHGKISEEEAEAEQNKPFNVKPKAKRYQSSNTFNANYTAYMSQVESELRNSVEFKDYDGDVLNLGLKVYTNLDRNIQDSVSNSMNNNLANIKPASDIAMVVLNNENSGISAIYGGKDFRFGGFNYATQSKLQPGSSIKPILAFAPAIEYLGWGTAQLIDDSKLPGSNIQNWDRKFHGNVTMNDALKMSYNIPAIKTYQSVGIDNVRKYAENVGIKVTDDSITSPIGGSADGYSPLQMAAAYVPFSNGGYYATPKTIKRVVDDTGLELTEFSKSDKERVIKESTAYIMTAMLRNVLDGTATAADIPGLDMGVKTGTTTFSEADAKKFGFDVDAYSKDSWIVGYTNRYTMAVWQGFDAIDAPTKYMTSDDSRKTQTLYRINMQEIARMYPTSAFVAPSDVGNFRGGLKVLTDEDRRILAEEARRAEEERRRQEEEARIRAEEEKRKLEESTSQDTTTTSETNTNSNSNNADSNESSSLLDLIPFMRNSEDSGN